MAYAEGMASFWARFKDSIKRKPQLYLEAPEAVPSSPSNVFQSIKFGLGDSFTQHPEHGLTMRRIFSIYRDAEAGFPREQCDLFDGVIERDGHLRSQLETRLESVSGKGWLIQAGGDEPEDLRASKILDYALRQVPNFIETVEHQLQDKWYGFAGTEIIWDRMKIPGEGVFTVPVWFCNPPSRRFVFTRPEDEAKLVTAADQIYGEPLLAGKWIFGRSRGRFCAMGGIMRTAAIWALFKTLSMRDLMIVLAKFGIPLAIGQYPDGLPDEEKKVLTESVKKIGTDGSATFNDRASITITQFDASKSNNMHQSVIALCNDEISKLVAGGTLTSGTPEKGTGSYALGDVHADMRFDKVLGDAERMSNRFEQQLGQPFVTFNGLQARAPRPRFPVVRLMDPLSRMKLYLMYQQAGGQLDAQQLREELQIKKPVGEVLQPPVPPPVGGGGASASQV